MATPRSQAWTKPTVLMTIVLIVLIIGTVVTDMIGDPPTYLTGLLGTAAGAWFAAIANDKKKFDQAVSKAANDAHKTATRAEAKADTLADVAVSEHAELDTREDLGPSFAPDDPDTLDPPTTRGSP